MSPAILVIICFMAFCGFVIYSAINMDRPERVSRRDRKNFEAKIKALEVRQTNLVNLINEIDAQARAEQMVNSTNSLAWAVTNEVGKARKELSA